MQRYHAIYARVSDPSQSDGTSIESQLETAETYILNKYGADAVIRKYVDSGISGRKIDRAEFNILLNDIKNERVHTAYFYKLDRMARNTKETLVLYDDYFEPTGTNLKSMTQEFDTSTTSGKMMFQMLAVVAEMESSHTSDRVKAAIEYKKQNGLVIAGVPPIGYKLVNSLVVIDEEKKHIAIDIFESMANGSANITSLAERYGFNLDRVYRILTNKIYIGYLRHKKEWYKGIHEPLISEELFLSAQKIKTRKHKKVNTNVFSGLITCDCCGHSYYARNWIRKYPNGKTFPYRYYYCGGTKKSYKFGTNPDICKNNKQINYDKLEERFLNELSNMKITGGENKKSLSNNDKRKSIEFKIKGLEEKKNKLTDLYLSELIELDDMKARKIQLDNKIIDLRTELDSTTTFVKTMTKREVKEIIRVYMGSDEEEKSQIAHSMISSITANNGVITSFTLAFALTK